MLLKRKLKYTKNLSAAFQAKIDQLVNKLEYTNIKKTFQT